MTERIRALDYPTLMGNYDQGVGNDSDDCGCAYTRPETDGGELTVDFHRVGYDIERIAAAIEASDMPSEYAQMLRDGKG